MDICLLMQKNDTNIPRKDFFLRGDLSYVAKGKTLYSENRTTDKCDILVISADNADNGCAAAIINETKKRLSHGVFLDFENNKATDFEKLCEHLSNHKLQVFTPLSKDHIPGTIPVVSSSVTGGSLHEHFEETHNRFRNFAVSIERMSMEFPLPCTSSKIRMLTKRGLLSKISRYEPDIFFSPQMQCKYFLYNPSGDEVFAVLFDDNETISGKLRLAKKHGAVCSFLVFSEICDIFNDIIF